MTKNTAMSFRVEASAGRPWVVLCNTVGVPHAVFDRLLAELAGSFSVVCWSTSLTERDEPAGKPVELTVEEQTAEVTERLKSFGVREFVGVSWCSGTEILYRLSQHEAFRVLGHCCLNPAFNLGPEGPCSEWERSIEPIFQVLCDRPEVLPGVSALLGAAAASATRGGDPSLAFPYSTPERVLGYAAQCLGMKRGRTFEGFVRSVGPGLYLAGSADEVQPFAVSRTAAQRSGAGFELIDGGHHAMVADLPEVSARVREYCVAAAALTDGH
ncbi:hypothetical protein [Kitasatospora sp. NPDC093806]|uniref:hypothetical protein n=1 Tax=Kitasatospora sp. NPDC093806 TaxID=3155075 RepID=UPI00342409C9